MFLVLGNHRRQILHFNVGEAPSAAWTGQQIIEAIPWGTAPRFLIRDRDGIYGTDFTRQVDAMGIEQIPIAARSPWQNPFVEPVIGSLRRECLDQMIVLNEMHLRRLLKEYLAYYHGSRTHLGLGKDCPGPERWSHQSRGGSSSCRWSGASITGTFARLHRTLPARRALEVPAPSRWPTPRGFLLIATFEAYHSARWNEGWSWRLTEDDPGTG